MTDALTADNGRIIVEHQRQGCLWEGRQLAPRERPLVIAMKDFSYATGKEILDKRFRFEAAGVAPLAYLGYPDGSNPTADELRAMRKKGQTAVSLLAEVKPDGEPLVASEPLTDAEVVRLGVALCDTMLGWIDRRGSAIVGFRPETVYVAGTPGMRHYAGATPRVFALLGSGDIDGSFPTTYYGAPLAASSTELDREDVAFMVALVLWFAATHEHAVPHLQYIEHPRPAFAGRDELGELFLAALDLDDRMGVLELREGLAKLMHDWRVEPPPFPPPGLAAS